MQTVYLCRHSQSLYNAGINKGFDTSLSIQGIHQAHVLATMVESKLGGLQNIDCFTSPYLRCLQTSNAIFKYCPQTFLVDERLGEQAGDEHVERGYQNVYSRSEIFKNFKWSKNLSDGSYYINYQKEKDVLGFINKLTNTSFLVTHRPVIKKIMEIYGHEPVDVENCAVIRVNKSGMERII